MKALVINLESAPERLRFQEWQLSQIGVEFERQKAISAKEIPKLPARYWASWERPLRPAERAAFISHRQSWLRILDSGRPALILEDDAVLSAFAALLAGFQKAANAEHITLEVRARRKLVAREIIQLSNSIGIRRLYQDRSGAAAYILTPSGAQKLLTATENKAGLADAIICSAYNLRSYQCDPACAVQIDKCAAYGLPTPIETISAIGQAKKEKLLVPERANLSFIRYRIKRIAAQFRMARRMLSKYTRSEYRHVTLIAADFEHLRRMPL